MDERLASLQSEIAELDEAIEGERDKLRRQALDVEALKVTKYFSALRIKVEDELKETQQALQELQSRRTELVEAGQALKVYARRGERGDLGPPTAHLRHVHHPEPPLPAQHRIVEIWGALSGALILLAIALLLIFRPVSWPVWSIGLAIGLGALEAVMRDNLIDYLLNLTVILAVIAAVILLVEFWVWFLVAGLLVAVVFVLIGNLQELRR